ncbi:isopropylmalate isomerase [Antarcticimicrobium sp.]|nr:isopropylmalate isomerase [Antarcticimicrobium sp.]
MIETRGGCIWDSMTPEFAPCFDLQDRARLRERFFGAARTVLARL